VAIEDEGKKELIHEGKVEAFRTSEPGVQTIRRAHAIQPGSNPEHTHFGGET
jgi:hypothetical protein